MTEIKARVLIEKKIFVCAPFDLLNSQGLLEQFLARGIQPEIGLEGDCLYSCTDHDFHRVADRLSENGLACTLHAPFHDLSPGAADRHIAAATLAKLQKAFALIPVFRPRSIVCHLSYEENKHAWNRDKWVERACATFTELLEIAARHDTPVMLENTYETGPEIHREVLARLDSPLARFCLDCGHTLAFARTPWQKWLPELSPWLGQLHLHDNFGDLDSHLGLGQGIFDFPGLFAYLKENRLTPIATLEPHHPDGLEQSLDFIKENGFFV